MKRVSIILFAITCINFSCNIVSIPFNKPMNFITVADMEHFDWLPGLFKSIRTHNAKNKINILVFDIGLLPDQIQKLESEYKVMVQPIKMVHPDLCNKFVVRPNGRLARGWYAWKPVAFYQALEFFDYFLHIDAGKRVNGPLDNIFHAIAQDGYFFYDCGHQIRPMTTNYVVKIFNLDKENSWILDEFGVEAGFQGLSERLREKYIYPMYLFAHDLRNFADDGTAPWGFGGARHDQTLFSILAKLNHYKIHKADGNGPNFIQIGAIKIPFKPINIVTYKEFNENPLAEKYHLI